jgi:hypothetical protein
MLGCGGTAFKTPTTGFEENGYRTSSEIEPKHIQTYELCPDIEDVEFVVLVTFNDANHEAYKEFIRNSLVRMGFNSVISELEFIHQLQLKGLDKKIGNLYDWNKIENMQAASSEFPRYLVIESVLTNGNHGSTTWLNQLKVIDPRKPKVLIEVTQIDTLWMSFEKEFAYPTANFLNNWYQESL